MAYWVVNSVAECCIVMQCVAVHCSMLQVSRVPATGVRAYEHVLQRVAA